MTPQYIEIDKVGNKFSHKDKEMTIFHREDGPAIEWSDGSKSWWFNGKLHREDGPAIERADGTTSWWLNGELHREDGPAIEYANGGKVWYLNDKLHREDGPAVEWSDGYKAWYLNGKRLSEEEFLKRTAKEIVLTMDEIAAKLGIEVSKLKIKK
jgi:hypothetical protein